MNKNKIYLGIYVHDTYVSISIWELGTEDDPRIGPFKEVTYNLEGQSHETMVGKIILKENAEVINVHDFRKKY